MTASGHGNARIDRGDWPLESHSKVRSARPFVMIMMMIRLEPDRIRRQQIPEVFLLVPDVSRVFESVAAQR